MEKNQQDKTQKIIKLGICAMEKKVYSKHMQNILNGLRQYSEISIIIFDESIIFGKQIEDWPIVDALIIFFSDGFPYKKGLQYVNYRNPFLINDFEMQKVFWDRRKVLSILKKEKISIPKHIIVDRGEVIDNDGEKINSLNKSAEIEKKIKSFHEELERMNETYDDDKKEIEEEKITNKKDNTNLNKNEEKKKKNEKIKEEKDKNPIIKTDLSKDDLIEYDDHIEYKGKKQYKPFVEKPANGDDHFVYIYYPPNHGGGSIRLFRKTKDECSLFFSKVIFFSIISWNIYIFIYYFMK
jgi:inositol hexakisphosphate/diphosphoinositol-pentakisphosphate kinase